MEAGGGRCGEAAGESRSGGGNPQDGARRFSVSLLVGENQRRAFARGFRLHRCGACRARGRERSVDPVCALHVVVRVPAGEPDGRMADGRRQLREYLLFLQRAWLADGGLCRAAAGRGVRQSLAAAEVHRVWKGRRQSLQTRQRAHGHGDSRGAAGDRNPADADRRRIAHFFRAGTRHSRRRQSAESQTERRHRGE